MNDSQAIYTERINYFSKQLHEVEGKIKNISFLRLSIVLTSIVLFYFALTQNTILFYIIAVLVVTFIALVIIHAKLFRKRDLISNSIIINEEEIKYLHQDYSSFEDGNEFINTNHPYTFDLDIYGKGSLFQSLNRTCTYKGKFYLSQSLSQLDIAPSEILSRQECIKELKDKLDFRQEFQATGKLLNETLSDREKLKNWLSENLHFASSKILPFILYSFPLAALIFLCISIIQWETHPVLLICILSNWVIYGFYGKKINRLYSLISKKKNLLENFADLFNITHQENFKTKELEDLRTSLKDASVQFKRLSDYVGWLDQRLNILISPFLNSIFLYDLQFCYLIEKWRLKNDSKVLHWIDTVGKLDALCSLGNFSYNNADFCFPEISTNEILVEAKDLAHPLIKPKKRIPNDFHIGKENQTAIITGANMAGKSTFLRTLGINIILAYTGAPVCASIFKISQLDLISSMRVSDSLKDETSYFYAELQKLKSIRDKVASGKPLLVLLDEMLRGTNSKDKQQGSKAFVEGLLPYNALTIVATHDLLLGQLEQEYPSKIKNFCFESFLNDNKLFFDYKIRNGMAQNTNASFLMKNLGII